MAQLLPFTEDLYFSAQLSPKQLENLNLVGIKSVINLRASEEAGFLQNEDQMVAKCGVSYLQIPLLVT